jgi:hypothetical protein
MRIAIRPMAHAVVLVGAFLLAGCVGSVSGQLTIPSEVAGKSSYYVEQSPQDERNLSALIAERMRARGLNATAGAPGPVKPDFVVTYVDKWYWDMRMYLADMRIEVRDANDRSIVGYGQSAQSSLKAMGKSFADVIDAALDELFRRK